MDIHVDCFGRNGMIAALRALAAAGALCVLIAAAPSAQAAIPQSERDALTALYDSTQGPLWTNRAGWKGSAGSECYWAGVTCDATQSTVVGIDLPNNNLHGTLTALAPFTNLAEFDVSQNSLTGAIPALTGLTKLQVFKVFSNQLGGSLPALTGLAALTEFRVWSNQLTGPIPSLADTTQLQYFDAQANQLSGGIPALTQLASLREFNVASNQLTGSMPDFTGLANLKKIDVSLNQLTGAISAISGNASLQALYVDHNNLSGALPVPPASLVVAAVCPNAGLTPTPSATWDSLTGQSPWYQNCAGAAQLVVTNIYGGVSPKVGAKFSVTVSLQDTTGAPAIITSSNSVQLSLAAGSGLLFSQNLGLSCQIPVGGSSCTMSDVSYSIAESGIRLQATLGYSYPQLIVSSPPSAPFTVVPGTYTVGGTVSGLTGSGLVLSLFPGSQRLAIGANGTFTFPLALGNGAYYAVSVASSPSSPLQQCSFQGPAATSGNISGGSITNISVGCVPLRTVTVVAGQNGYNGSPTQTVANGNSANLYFYANNGFKPQVSAHGCTVTRLDSTDWVTSPLNSDCAVSVTFVPLQYTPVQAVRLLDTRHGKTTTDGAYAGIGPLAGQATLALPILGRGNLPTTGVGAVVLNVTVSNTTAAEGYLTAWPSCVSRPVASNLNYVTGLTVSNLVIVAAGCDVTSNFVVSTGPTDVVVDLVGYFSTGSTIQPLSPSRLLDTRPGAPTIDGIGAGGGGPLPTNHQVDLAVTGRAGIPAGASAVAMNVTSTDTVGPGFVTAWPTDVTRPLASNLNYVAGQTIPNLVITKLSAGGQISLFNSARADLIADAVAWFPSSSELTPITPARLVDTRPGGTTVDGYSAGTGIIVGGSYPYQFDVRGRGGVPGYGVSAVVLNVTATNPTASGSLTVWAAYSSQPQTTNVNYVAGQTVPNLVIVPAINGYVFVAASPGSSTHIVVDVVGWFVGP